MTMTPAGMCTRRARSQIWRAPTNSGGTALLCRPLRQTRRMAGSTSINRPLRGASAVSRCASRKKSKKLAFPLLTL